MPGLSFQKIVSLSEQLNTALKPQLTDMPHLQGESDDIDAFLTEVKSLGNEQEALTGRLREITRLRRAAEQRGTDLRSRVAAQIQGKLGFTNENLLAYGITPRKRERKKPTKKQTPLAIDAAAEENPGNPQ